MSRKQRLEKRTRPTMAAEPTAAEAQRRARRWKIAAGAGGGLLVAVLIGSCWNADPPPSRPPSPPETHDAEMFFTSAIASLHRLDESVSLDTVVETTIVDRDANGEQLEAVMYNDPNSGLDPKEKQPKLISVLRGNGQFVTRGVVRGDRVYYFAKMDEVDQRMIPWKGHNAFELTVDEVLDENTLRTVDLMTGDSEIPFPLKIVRRSEKTGPRDRFIAWMNTPIAAIDWEPSPDREALEQAVGNLDQWVGTTEEEIAWAPEPMLDTLIGQNAAVTRAHQEVYQQAGPDRMSFDLHDGRFLQETLWLRSIATRIAGREQDNLKKAELLFDWTARNIDLAADDDPQRMTRRPWHTLLFGRGTADERAWVFILLARQLHLDVVMLAYKNPRQQNVLTFWIPALLNEGELYLFDTRLGLPIPAGDGRGVATLAGVLADASLLARLDLDEKQPYEPHSGDLQQQVVAFVEASPQYLTRRMRLVESKLAGDEKMVLTTDPSRLAAAVKQTAGVSDVRLWPIASAVFHLQRSMNNVDRMRAGDVFRPFAVVPQLWKARTLHLNGKFNEREVRERNLTGSGRLSSTPEVVHALPGATKFYMNTLEMKGAANDSKNPIWKQHAEYWSGMIHYEQGDYAVAAKFFRDRVLKADPKSPWTAAARYNLARCYERQGKLAEARKLYEQDTSAQRHGNLLRARRLAEMQKEAAQAAGTSDAQRP